jgi:four helix bundle protein
MTKDELKIRTKKYGIEIIRFLYSLPRGTITSAITNQLVRSATSIGANYRAALRSRSDKEFIARIGIIVEEADETLYWLEIMNEVSQFSKSKNEIELLMKEANELTAIFVSTLKTLKTQQNLTS